MICVCPCYTISERLNICTFNLRADNSSDGINIWANRKDSVMKIFKRYDMDIIGAQEVRPSMLSDLNSLADYSIEAGNQNWISGNSITYRPIIYKKNKFSIIKKGAFWMSDTPNVSSLVWNYDKPLTVTWVLFEDNSTKEQFYVFNTHLPAGTDSYPREKCVEFLCDRIPQIVDAEKPFFLMGDMNCEPKDKPYLNLLSIMQDARHESIATPTGPIGTFQSFGKITIPIKRIDFIFLNSSLATVHTYQTVDERYPNKICPSDHNAVLISVELKKKTNIENNYADDFVIFPNPCKSSFKIKNFVSNNNKDKIRIIDETGSIKLETSYENNKEIKINLPKGLYLLEISSTKIRITKKLIVK